MTPCPLHSMQVKRPRVAASPMSLSQAVGYREARTWKPRKALPRKNDVRSTATSTRTRANASRSSRRSRVCRFSTSWKPFWRITSADGRNSTKWTSRRCEIRKASRLANRAPRPNPSSPPVGQPRAVGRHRLDLTASEITALKAGSPSAIRQPLARSNASARVVGHLLTHPNSEVPFVRAV